MTIYIRHLCGRDDRRADGEKRQFPMVHWVDDWTLHLKAMVALYRNVPEFVVCQNWSSTCSLQYGGAIIKDCSKIDIGTKRLTLIGSEMYNFSTALKKSSQAVI